MSSVEDRISSLPDDVLIRIISKLDSTVQAVRTGILSIRWRNLWAHTTNLRFSLEDFLPQHDVCGEADAGLVSRKFADFVNYSLMLHSSPEIRKFSLDFACWSLYPYLFSSWVQFALRRGVRKLRLSAWPSDMYPVPSWLSPCSTLTKLYLDHCLIEFKHFNFPSLTHLHLVHCAVHINLLNCPSLTRLDVQSSFLEFNECVRMNSVSELFLSEEVFFEEGTLLSLLTASNHLQALALEGSPFVEDVQFLRFDSLCFLSLYGMSFETAAFTRFLQACPLLQDLRLEKLCAECVIPSSNLQLKRLTITSDNVRSEEVVVEAPNLQILEVSLCDFSNLSLVEMLSLKMADLNFGCMEFTPTKHVHFMKLLEDVRHADVLKLSEQCVKEMSVFSPKALHPYLLKAKHLELCAGSAPFYFPGLKIMLCCSPDIETLTIKFDGLYHEACGFDAINYQELPTLSISCLEHRLKTIKIIINYCDNRHSQFFKGLTLELLRLLLTRARVLRNMTIHVMHYSSSPSEEIMSTVAKELASFPRVSPSVELVVV